MGVKRERERKSEQESEKEGRNKMMGGRKRDTEKERGRRG